MNKYKLYFKNNTVMCTKDTILIFKMINNSGLYIINIVDKVYSA